MFFWHFPGGKACPPDRVLQEHRACNDHPCVHFYWETSPWSSCSEDSLVALNATFSWSGEATCGVGIQTRKVSCMKSSSGHVTPKRYSKNSHYQYTFVCITQVMLCSYTTLSIKAFSARIISFSNNFISGLILRLLFHHYYIKFTNR